MKKYMGSLVLVLVGVLGFFMFISQGESETSRALRRVETMLKGITSSDGGNTTAGNEESAICMWFMGALRMADRDLLEHASDEFDRWKRKGGLGLYIKEHTVDGAEELGKSVVVFGTINGEPFEVIVPEKGPVAWKTPPISDDE